MATAFTKEQRKEVMQAIRLELVHCISSMTQGAIESTIKNAHSSNDFVDQILRGAKLRLRIGGKEECISDEVWRPEIVKHSCLSVIGGMVKCVEDLHMQRSPEDMAKFVFWDAVWKEEKSRSKRAKEIDCQFTYSKRQRKELAAASVAEDDTFRPPSDKGGVGHLESTVRNDECAVIVCVPTDCINWHEKIGSGSYGDCFKVSLTGLSYFPSHITYAAKKYRGSDGRKFEAFDIEQGMQRLHPSLVRCIGKTSEAPWVTIFPYFNGGTLGDMMMKLPFRFGTYRRVAMKLMQGGTIKDCGTDPMPNGEEMARLKGFLANVPSMIGALIDAMAVAHAAGMSHCDLHAENVVLDFTKSHHPRIGVIDWGLTLKAGEKRRSCNYVLRTLDLTDATFETKKREAIRRNKLRPWQAPEVVDPTCDNAYSKASDVYALGWLIGQIGTFWKECLDIYLQVREDDHPDCVKIKRLMQYAQFMMMHNDRDQRPSMSEMKEKVASLNLNAQLAQRPLVECSPRVVFKL